MEEEVPQAQKERRKRGPTMCTSTSEAKELSIEFTEDGRAKGPNRIKYSNWCSTFVKQKADIRIESWLKIDDETKDEWWNIVKVKHITIKLLTFIILH